MDDPTWTRPRCWWWAGSIGWRIFSTSRYGRRRRITLTAAGVTLADELIATHLANEQRLLSSLTYDQVSDLARLLAILAENLEARHT